MKKASPAISVVMPARNEGGRVAKAIQSFSYRRSHLFPLEFIIVDDASTDGCCDGLEALMDPAKDSVTITAIRLNNWSGIPFSRNTGAYAANAPILFITDANVEACPDWDVPVFREIRPDRALCATIADLGSSWRGYGCLLDLPSMGINWLRNPRALGGYAPVAPCTGTAIYKQLYINLGGYDTAMPVYGAAEPEFSVRIWLYGADIVVCPDLVLLHRFRPPGERRPFLSQIRSIQTQNYIRFGLLYLDQQGTDKMLQYWQRQSPEFFEQAYQNALADVWDRRQHLAAILPRNFKWYETFFSTTINQ